MKTLLKSFILLFVISITIETAKARIIWNLYKSGGLFGGFNKVEKTYDGQDQWGNELHTLRCSGVGFNGCRKGGTVAHPGSQYTALHAFTDPYVAEVEDEAENEVLLGNFQGNTSRQIAWDKDADGQYDSLVLIDATWDSQDSDFNDGTMVININEVAYP